MNSDYISKAIVSAAVTDATNAVKPLLLAAEALASGETVDGVQMRGALAAIHNELSNQLGIADGLLDTGTMHTDGGGTDKGDGGG